MEIKLPQSFYLHGQKINIIMVDHIASENGSLGEARMTKNEIAIQQNSAGFKRPQTQVEQTFYHELVHFILHHMGQDELCGEEQFVDGFSQLLHQAMASMEFGKKKEASKRGK